MENLTENLFQAVNLVVDNAITKAQFDKTYICKIIDVKTFQDGYYKYTLKYEDSGRTFISYDTKKYSKDTNVVVKIINGNWNNQPVIEGMYFNNNQVKTIIYDYNNNFIKKHAQSLSTEPNECITFNQLKNKQFLINKENLEIELNYFGLEFLINSSYMEKGYFTIDINLFILVDVNEDNYIINKYWIKEKDNDESIIKEDDYEYYDEDFYYYDIITYNFSSKDIIGYSITDDSYFPFSILFDSNIDLNRQFYITLIGKEYNGNGEEVIKLEEQEDEQEGYTDIMINLSRTTFASGILQTQEENLNE